MFSYNNLTRGIFLKQHLELKQDHRSKIAEKNAIISKICLELKMEPNLYTPDDHVLENPEQLLEVLFLH